MRIQNNDEQYRCPVHGDAYQELCAANAARHPRSAYPQRESQELRTHLAAKVMERPQETCQAAV